MTPKAKFYQVIISSELRTQGMRLLEHLIRKELIFGGPVLSGPARFLWKNEIVEHDYCWTHHVHPRRPPRRAHPRGGEGVGRGDLHDLVSPFDGSPAIQALLEEAFVDAGNDAGAAYKDAVAALTFVVTGDIPNRTISSWGDLSKVQPQRSDALMIEPDIPS